MERTLGIFAELDAAVALVSALDDEFCLPATPVKTQYDDYEIVVMSKSPNLSKYRTFSVGFLMGWTRYERENTKGTQRS